MTTQEISKTDLRLLAIYETPIVMPETTEQFVDRSETLFAQMNFIAVNNMSFMNKR